MLKKLSAFVFVSTMLAACGDAGPVEESIDTMELAAKPPSCPYSSSCPSPPSGYTWMYWYDQSYYGNVACYYRKSTYPYNVQIVNVSDGGCGLPAADCCPGAMPCSNGPHYFSFFTCY